MTTILGIKRFIDESYYLPEPKQIKSGEELDISYIECVESPDSAFAEKQWRYAEELWKEHSYEKAHRIFIQSALQGNNKAITSLNKIYTTEHTKIGLSRSLSVWNGSSVKETKKPSLAHLIDHYKRMKVYDLLFALYLERIKRINPAPFQTELGRMCLKGRGVKKDQVRGIAYLEESKHEDRGAIKLLRHYYLKRGDFDKTLNCFEEFASYDARRSLDLAEILERGFYYGYSFSPLNEKAATIRAQVASTSASSPPSIEAKNADPLEKPYLECVKSPNKELAIQQLERAKQLWKDEAYSQAHRLYIQSALQGNQEACTSLALIYEKDHTKLDVPRSAHIWSGLHTDKMLTALSKLMSHYRPSSEHDLFFALCYWRSQFKKPELAYLDLGLSCLKGRGIERDIEQGLNYLKKAYRERPQAAKILRKKSLKNGDIHAALYYSEILAQTSASKSYRLGRVYEKGRLYGYRFPVDRSKAASLFRSAFALAYSKKDEAPIAKILGKMRGNAEEKDRPLWEILELNPIQNESELTPQQKLILGYFIPPREIDFFQSASAHRLSHYLLGLKEPSEERRVDQFIEGMKLGCPLACQEILARPLSASLHSEASLRLAIAISKGDAPDFYHAILERKVPPDIAVINNCLAKAAQTPQIFIELIKQLFDELNEFHPLVQIHQILTTDLAFKAEIDLMEQVRLKIIAPLQNLASADNFIYSGSNDRQSEELFWEHDLASSDSEFTPY